MALPKFMPHTDSTTHHDYHVTHDESFSIDDVLLSQKLMQAISDIVYIYDLDSQQTIYTNRSFAALLNHHTQTHTNGTQANLPVILHPDDVAPVSDQLQKLKSAADSDVLEITYRLQDASGAWRWFTERQMIYTRHSDGTVAQVLKIAGEQSGSNINAALDPRLEREKLRLLSEFIGTTYHEIRTPLTIINTSLYLMKKIDDPTKQGARVEVIENQVAQLSRLISQMQLLMRLDALRHTIELKPVSLNILLTRLQQDLAKPLAKKEMTLDLTFADDLPPIFADYDLLLVGIQNIIENAIVYTPSGTIKAQTMQEDGNIILIVEDSGIGIAAEDLPHIFERFYKIEKTIKITPTGAGLGLAITRRIMDLYGGRIEVESELGQGTTVRLFWPIDA